MPKLVQRPPPSGTTACACRSPGHADPGEARHPRGHDAQAAGQAVPPPSHVFPVSGKLLLLGRFMAEGPERGSHRRLLLVFFLDFLCLRETLAAGGSSQDTRERCPRACSVLELLLYYFVTRLL